MDDINSDLDASTVAYYRFEEGPGTTFSRDGAGRSPDAELVVGGDPSGPEWSTDTPF